MGAWLRFHALAQDVRFHPDEALYSTFARDAAIKGEWMLPGLLDKPPLTIYANALSMTFVGVSINNAGVLDFPTIRVGEFAARLPNTLASILLVALVYALARSLFNDNREGRRRAVPLQAMLLMALSPFAIAFSATAFTDVFMVLWSVMALWMAARGRWGTSGSCLALGLASKQAAVLYLPLIVIVGLLCALPSSSPLPIAMERGWGRGLTRFRAVQSCRSLRRLVRFAGALAVGVALLMAWDAARGQPSIWQVSAARENYPDRLVDTLEILPRLSTWVSYGQWLIGPGALTAVLSGLALAAAVARMVGQHRKRSTRLDAILAIYVLGYGLLHWLAAFNTFDRYLLPLAPLLAILAARGMEFVVQGRRDVETHRIAYVLLGIVVLGFSLPTAWNGREARVNVGGDLGKHDGVDQVAEYLNGQPVATVVYDRWLGWELRFYLGPWSDKRLTYYPTPDALVKDALALREIGPRYFPVPRDQDATEWLEALDDAGFAPMPILNTKRFVVYRLTPPGSAAGDATAG